MKKNRITAMLLALVMCLSLMACGSKPVVTETFTGEELGLYVMTNGLGERFVVDRNGEVVDDYTLDDSGNVLDDSGAVVVKAADLTTYTPADAADADTAEPDDSAAADDTTKEDADKAETDKKDETKADEAVKDEQPEDEAKKDETPNADETKKDEETKQEETKTDNTKADTKVEDTKPAAPSYNNGSLTTSQVKEMQRYYGVSADGQWGNGSASAAGGMDADDAWVHYQNSKPQTGTTAPSTPSSSGNSGSSSTSSGSASFSSSGSSYSSGNSSSSYSSDNSYSSGGSYSSGSSTVVSSTPSTPAKADVDCEEAMRVGNEYAVSLGFYVDSTCRSYRPPCYFEEDFPASMWDQETFNNAVKWCVDDVKTVLERDDDWTPELSGWCMGIYCVARWNESEGVHEIYVYYGGGE